VKGQNSLC